MSGVSIIVPSVSWEDLGINLVTFKSSPVNNGKGKAIILPELYNFSDDNLGKITPNTNIPLIELGIYSYQGDYIIGKGTVLHPMYYPEITLHTGVSWKVIYGLKYASINEKGFLEISKMALEDLKVVVKVQSTDPAYGMVSHLREFTVRYDHEYITDEVGYVEIEPESDPLIGVKVKVKINYFPSNMLHKGGYFEVEQGSEYFTNIETLEEEGIFEVGRIVGDLPVLLKYTLYNPQSYTNDEVTDTTNFNVRYHRVAYDTVLDLSKYIMTVPVSSDNFSVYMEFETPIDERSTLIPFEGAKILCTETSGETILKRHPLYNSIWRILRVSNYTPEFVLDDLIELNEGVELVYFTDTLKVLAYLVKTRTYYSLWYLYLYFYKTTLNSTVTSDGLFDAGTLRQPAGEINNAMRIEDYTTIKNNLTLLYTQDNDYKARVFNIENETIEEIEEPNFNSYCDISYRPSNEDDKFTFWIANDGSLWYRTLNVGSLITYDPGPGHGFEINRLYGGGEVTLLANHYGNLLRVYITLEDPTRGVSASVRGNKNSELNKTEEATFDFSGKLIVGYGSKSLICPELSLDIVDANRILPSLIEGKLVKFIVYTSDFPSGIGSAVNNRNVAEIDMREDEEGNIINSGIGEELNIFNIYGTNLK